MPADPTTRRYFRIDGGRSTRLESTDPAVKRAAEKYDRTVAQIVSAGERMNPGGWVLIDHPKCDRCWCPASWRHPDGGLRCLFCKGEDDASARKRVRP